VAELAPDSCRGVERAVPFLTATEGLGRRVVLETVDSAVTGCALGSRWGPLTPESRMHTLHLDGDQWLVRHGSAPWVVPGTM